MPINTTTDESISFDYLEKRYKHLLKDIKVNFKMVIDEVLNKLPDKITSNQLDELSAVTAASFSSIHPDYSNFGGRILVFNLHNKLDTDNTTFAGNINKIYNSKINGHKSTRISKPVYEFVQRNEDKLQEIINYERDLFQFDYASIASFLKRGLSKINGVVAETPSQMFLRCAVGVNVFASRKPGELEALKEQMGYETNTKALESLTDEERLENIKEYYELLAKRKISLPGPILMHAGSETNQMASCFLEYTSDSLTEDGYHIDGNVGGIMKAMTQLAAQSKGGAGTAVSLSAIRGKGSPISKTGGRSNGILPFMKMFDSTIGAIDQSGSRAGVCTVYLEPWHVDILDFLDAADHFTIEEKRCKHLFFAIITTDLFFERLITDQMDAKWTLFDPVVTKEYLNGVSLDDLYGKEWQEAYLKLEKLGVGKTISLMEIWSRVCKLLQTRGLPYVLNKDAMNAKSNSKNTGVVRSSNVCTEITLPSNEKETAVCVLTAICLGKYYDESKKDKVDYEAIIKASALASKNLNNVIDLQYYPTPETRNACLSRRAIGIGSMGIADLLAQIGLDFGSDEAKRINKNVYECIYFGAMMESNRQAKISGSYLGFEGSPAQQGILQYDMWGVNEDDLFLSKNYKDLDIFKGSSKNPWIELKNSIKNNGLRNSEVTAIAPTASSSIRMEQTEMHEPFGRNIYIRQTVAGSIQIINKYMVYDLIDLGLWNQELAQKIIDNDGSVQGISEIPENIQSRYQTIYEMDWKTRIDMMRDRAPFVSQSASFNHYVKFEDVGPTAFTQRIIYAWKQGLKTLSYYIHTETATTAKKSLGQYINTSSITNPQEKVLADGQVCDPTDMTCEACQS